MKIGNLNLDMFDTAKSFLEISGHRQTNALGQLC